MDQPVNDALLTNDLTALQANLWIKAFLAERQAYIIEDLGRNHLGDLAAYFENRLAARWAYMV